MASAANVNNLNAVRETMDGNVFSFNIDMRAIWFNYIAYVMIVNGFAHRTTVRLHT